VSATGEDQDIADALLVECGLTTVCGAKPGEPCVNSCSKEIRDAPHWNRVVKGRLARRPS
jgi:hypothetical protein